MLCLIKKKSRMLTFFGVFLLSLLFTSVFGSSSSFATSISCNISSLTSGQNYKISDYCDTSTLDPSIAWYYYGYLTPITPASNGFRFSFHQPTYVSTATCSDINCANIYALYIQSGNVSSGSYYYIIRDTIGQPGSYTNHFDKFVNIYTGASDFSLKISDDIEPLNPTSSITITSNGTYNVASYGTAVVDVPPIYGDYHNDLISINNSILVCASVCLVIYFFYCIYRMIIRSSK